MATTHRLVANFSQSIGKEFPPITALKTMVFFGTGYDAIETNRVTGGPALTVLSGAPMHSANYVSLGGLPVGAPTSWDSINTQNVRDATMLASGWTWAIVVRATSAMTAMAISDGTQTLGYSGAFGIALNNGARAYLYNNGARYNYTSVTPTTAWHFFVLTYTGGAAGTLTFYDFTDHPIDGAPGTYVAAGTTAQTYFSPRLGAISADNAAYQGTCDISWAMVSGTPMTAPSLSTLAAAVRPWLARRGIVA